MCGADFPFSLESAPGTGSPPRVRSRPHHRRLGLRHHGITSACAEQTGVQAAIAKCARDHLRVCGADNLIDRKHTVAYGSPPRVRSRPAGRRVSCPARRITSACAEQTLSRSRDVSGRKDHLRVCGADVQTTLQKAVKLGSPPRVRSRRGVTRGENGELGITSACAEQTPHRLRWLMVSRDHLRVCGADPVGVMQSPNDRGSPPRVRSRQDEE